MAEWARSKIGRAGLSGAITHTRITIAFRDLPDRLSDIELLTGDNRRLEQENRRLRYRVNGLEAGDGEGDRLAITAEREQTGPPPMTEDSGVWLYAVTRRVPQDALTGLSGVGGGSVRAVETADLSAVVSPVSLGEFGADALRRNLEDLDWLAATARARPRRRGRGAVWPDGSPSTGHRASRRGPGSPHAR